MVGKKCQHSGKVRLQDMTLVYYIAYIFRKQRVGGK